MSLCILTGRYRISYTVSYQLNFETILNEVGDEVRLFHFTNIR